MKSITREEFDENERRYENERQCRTKYLSVIEPTTLDPEIDRLTEALTQIRVILEGARGTLAEAALEIAKEALNGKKP